MIKTIEYGHNYAIYLSDLYGGYKRNVQVIGITNINNVAVNSDDDYNIYSTYFEPIGLGLTSYYTAINQSTKIYICLVISALSPFTVSEEKIFIPESLINMDKSQEYCKVSNLSFTIYPIIKQFSDEDDKTKFINGLIERMKGRLRGLVEFALLDTEVESKDEEYYMTVEDYESISAEREYSYSEYYAKKQKNNEVKRQNADAYNELIRKVTAEKEQYTALNAELQTKINRYQMLIDHLESGD